MKRTNLPSLADVEPTPGELWRHYKGGVYRIVRIGYIEATNTPCVVYESDDADKRVWVRPVDDFMAKVSADEWRFRRA